MDSRKENGTGHKINNLKFADDIDLLEEDRNELQENLKRLAEAGEASGLKIKIKKTMTMMFGQENIIEELMINSTRIENVTEFLYLGSLLTCDNDCSKEIKRRIARATGAMGGFKNFKVMRNERASYACETWTLRKRDKHSLMAFEMKCYRRIFHIHWQQKVTNVEIGQRLDIKKNDHGVETQTIWAYLQDG